MWSFALIVHRTLAPVLCHDFLDLDKGELTMDKSHTRSVY